MAHTLACLRFADLVTETVARLATGLDGLTLGRAGFAPAGRRTEISRGHRASSYPNRPAGPGRTEFPIHLSLPGASMPGLASPPLRRSLLARDETHLGDHLPSQRCTWD